MRRVVVRAAGRRWAGAPPAEAPTKEVVARPGRATTRRCELAELELDPEHRHRVGGHLLGLGHLAVFAHLVDVIDFLPGPPCRLVRAWAGLGVDLGDPLVTVALDRRLLSHRHSR